MLNKINEAVCRYGMEEIYNGAIVGFSGGADSSAVLHYLKDRCKSLLAVHINHMIRGEEADRDEAFCREVCQSYGIDFLSFKVDIPRLSHENGCGLEEMARRERYRIFGEILEKNPKYKCVVTAHNSNDNAETIIFNLARGSGTNGLCGIKPVLGKVFRPLIYSSRDDIIKYCQDNNIRYVTDSTNSDTEYTRNHIRHNIVPQLLSINPNFLDSCIRLGDILRVDEEYISKEACLILNTIEDGRLSKDIVASLDGAVLARVLKKMAGTGLDYTAIKSCGELIKKWQAGKMINVEKGLTFKLEHDYCLFISTEETQKKEFCMPLSQDVNEISEIDAVVCINCDFDSRNYSLLGCVSLNPNLVKGKLYVRNKLDGDTIKSSGMTKKLKRVFTDKHIPSHKRGLLPIICDDEGIVAVPGIIARDGAFDKKGSLTIKAYNKTSIGGINEKEE